ncbi:unnamed protein product [Durusdinium trenchii]|uniref:Acyltransferase 3 domain-containing protein n=2 Tax=Durusdinium trenchii TaxID=1381693 RepID=A0ABP0I8F9_9DINO
MYLQHLQGVRSLCAAWVLCGRFLPDEHAGIWNVGLQRASCGVDIFIVLSGFVSQWNAPHEVREACSFYLRRAVRLLPAFWLAMAWSLVLKPEAPSPRCVVLLQWSKEEAMNCPNGATATVAMLLPCWLIYPWMSSPLCKLGAKQSFVAAVVCWFLVAGLATADDRHAWLQLDGLVSTTVGFGLGVAAARVAQEAFPDGAETDPLAAKSISWIWGALADLVAATAAVLVAFVRDSSRQIKTEARTDSESFPLRCISLFAALYFLFSSAGRRGQGVVQAVLSHTSLASLGKYTLYVYLFQEPLFRSIDLVVPLQHSAEGFVFFVLLLWLIAGLYAEHVELWLLQLLGLR